MYRKPIFMTLMTSVLTLGAATSIASADSIAPAVPSDVRTHDGVKKYLLDSLGKMNIAAADLKNAGDAYDQLLVSAGSPTAAAEARPREVADLIHKMRDAYQRLDSFGYEYVEGIVAGVPTLMKYDVELDSGVPRANAGLQDSVADIVIAAGPLTIDHEGSLNNFLIEPTVFGTNEKFVAGTATLPGFDKPVGLPRPLLVGALGAYAVDGYARLTRDASAWQPTDVDCFHILANMTPTLADYFDEWKESKKSGSAPGGRFVAVSRVSDMRGIMSSTRLAWLAEADDVRAKDAPLADKISRGYEQILNFIDTVDAREQRRPLNVEMIDALGSQAKEKADRLTVQANQAAALVGIDTNLK